MLSLVNLKTKVSNAKIFFNFGASGVNYIVHNLYYEERQ